MKPGKENLFDQAVDAIRADEPNPLVEAEAAAHVRAALFTRGVADETGRIHDCLGFRGLIPPYLQKTLSEARRMLLEDHLSECAGCRRAFDEARNGKPSLIQMPVPRPAVYRNHEYAKWAVAAGLLIAAGGTAWFTLQKPAPGEAVAQVDALDGFLFQVSDHSILPVGRGSQLVAGESVRAGRGAHSVVRLLDGSLIEMNERTELSIDRGWRGTRIHLLGGDIIVQAAKQKSGKLFVASGDSTVSVKGTIFAVSRGTRGTRVSVVEGAVQVDRTGADAQMLKPGEQSNSDPALTSVPVAGEVAWSHDAARYLALLGELSGLEKKLAAIPSPALRYQSKLLSMIPRDTMIFAAIPNVGKQLQEARQVFEEQTRSNAVLAEWWKGNSRNMNGLSANLDRLQTFSSYVGDEVVIAIRPNQTFSILAEAKSPDVSSFLDRELAGAPKLARRVHNGILMLASNEAELARLNASAESTPFRERIGQAYGRGAGWLLAVDMRLLNGRSTPAGHESAVNLGIDNLQYVVLERREVASRPETTASLNFGEQRRGVASWLGEPGPLATLDFVSPDAGAAVAFTMRNPRSVVEELLALAPPAGNQVDLGVINEIAAALGSEVTFAQDGPLLPDLSWKAAIEVNAPQTLQHSIETLVGSNKPMTLTSTVSGGYTFYTVSGPPLPMPVHYVFTDGYLIAAPSQSLLTQAIDNRRNGHNLARSERFRTQLPYGGSPNFSAVAYHNLSQIVSPVAEQLKKLNVMTQEQRAAADKLQEMTPTVISVYGEPNRITVSSMAGFSGLNLGVLSGLDRGLPWLLPTKLLNNGSLSISH
jgi:hypothetical protein